jgi:hypothetical protein
MRHYAWWQRILVTDLSETCTPALSTARNEKSSQKVDPFFGGVLSRQVIGLLPIRGNGQGNDTQV